MFTHVIIIIPLSLVICTIPLLTLIISSSSSIAYINTPAQTLHDPFLILALTSSVHSSTAAMRSLHLLAFCAINSADPALTVHSLGLPLASACPSFKADIRADTNRDGRVDLEGPSDTKDKTRWTEKSGAIFLPNIGDTDQRCLPEFTSRKVLFDNNLDDCHDASDNIQRSPEYLAPLKTVPIPSLAENENAKGTVTVPDATQRKLVRIFQKQGKDWVYIDNDHTFSQRELQAGLDLGIDARNTRRPKSRDTRNPERWDGRVTVRFTIQVGSTKSSDTVMLRVAPVLTHHHLQTVEQVLTVQDVSNPYLDDFANILDSITKAAGLKKEIGFFLMDGKRFDKWAQDFVEPGYASMPGPNGTVSIRILIRCPRAGTGQEGGQHLFLYFRKAGVGAVQHLGLSSPDIDAGGNIEAIPPYTFKGKIWRAGRLIVGQHGSKYHHILSYLEAQESQKPLRLDTDWLAVGHVDEFLQFIPANNTRGWVAVISDPILAIKILENAKKAGYGSLPAISRKGDNEWPRSCKTPECDQPVNSITVSQLLSNNRLMKLNKRCDRKIKSNIKTLRKEIGLTDEDIIRIPALFIENGPWDGPDSETKVGAFFPAAINNLVLTGYNTCIAPNPWGPSVGGNDIFAETISDKYAEVGMQIEFIDDWDTHHRLQGGVHCGTNSFRNMSAPWW
ncbi:arginine deiminase type-3 [Fusarium pseudoanthophilum]|uniref:Arginine deiminase type-3 n=1 Tax=Fusarium pseudoanthophilum TaxID=48495 RepID=A0A8H5UJX5_9HYPO|nr:arginine deiminase type-3 [Fusarium pseudoanthophilum]